MTTTRAAIARPPEGYWATNLYLDPRQRPKSDAPVRDLPQRAGNRFKKAREGVRSLRHVTEQVVFLGTVWKWVWMYEVGGRKLGYLHPMQSGVSGTFVLTEAEEQELVLGDGLPRVIKTAVREGELVDQVRWCWMEFADLDDVQAFVDVVRLKHQLLARPD
jgi:hypothetical protein